MTYVLLVWAVFHMHVFELHPKKAGSEFFPSFSECSMAGEWITEIYHSHHARYRCELNL